MELIICKDYSEMSVRAAQLAADAVTKQPEGLISFPGGDTPLGMVEQFAKLVITNRVDISLSSYVSLDEWVGLSVSDTGSCGRFNRENLLDPLEKAGKTFRKIHLINGAADDIERERQALDDFINAHGPLALSVLGIGMNGHLGFNEEGVDFSLSAHITPLSEVTRNVMQKYFGTQFHPTLGLTQGIGQVMQAEQVMLLASGTQKADIIARAVRGSVTNAVPASILQEHPNCIVILDEAAASKL